ncbi:MAG: sugar transferase [Chloroflexi bacterium]|nr:sugar transferase [Chloroflexota bacterium]
MPKRFNLRLFPYLLLCDVLLTLMALALARLARLYWPFGAVLVHPKAAYLHPAIYALVAVLWLFFFVILSVYNRGQRGRLPEELWTIGVAISTATAVLAGVLYLSFRQVPRLLFVYFFCFDLVFLLVFRVALRLFLRFQAGGRPEPERILIVGAGKVGREVAESIAGPHGWVDAEVVGFLDDDVTKQGQSPAGKPVLGTLDSITEVVMAEQIDQVIFTLPLRAHLRLINMAARLQKLPVDVKVIPDLFDLAFARTRAEEFRGFPIISLRESAISDYDKAVKRLFDIVVGGVMLLLAAPLILVISLLIKLDSPGTIIFKQQRVGENGQLFWMYKFRSMVTDAEEQLPDLVRNNEEGKTLFKFPDDPRVTRLGRLLRRTSLDELPQLINVLKGEMSLVGPRPELPFVVERYEPWERRRLTVPPGLTGWWQIRGRSDHPSHLNIEDDLYYIANYSLKLDLAILFKTVSAVVKGRGAY